MAPPVDAAKYPSELGIGALVMDYGQRVRFGVFITPDATQPNRPLALAVLADELARVRESVAKARA